MDPNNNQPIETNSTAQSIPQPATAPMSPQAPTPVAPTPAPSTPPQAPKGKNSKIIIILVILLLLVVGIVAYVLFAKNLMNNSQKTTTDNSSTVLPTPTLIPTLAPEEDLEVSSPEADLLEIDADVKAL